MRTLVRDKGAVAILDRVGDAVCAASAAVARELHVPLIGALSGAEGLSHAADSYVLRVRADFRREAAAIAAQLTQLGYTRIAIVGDASEPASESGLMAALAARGLQAKRVGIDATQAGIEATVRALGAGEFHAAVMSLAPGTAQQLANSGLADRDEWPSVLMISANGDLDPLHTVFKHRVKGVTQVVPNAEVLANPLARELGEDADRYGGANAVTPQGMEGYISARLLVEALRRAGAKGSPDRLVDALERIDDLSINGFHLGFGRGRETGSDWVEIGLRTRAGIFVN